MKKFRWGLIKALEFVNSKKNNIELTASILRSLNSYEKLLKNDEIGYLSHDWNSQYKKGEYY